MRKTLKKSFAVLLVIFMLIGTIPFAVFAATTQVSSLSELQSALAGAASGDVIDVTSDIALTASLTVSGKVTVKSSNGSSILRASNYKSYMFVVANGGELTLEDITINGNRTSYQTADLATEMIVVQAGGTLNFNDGTVLTTNRGNAAATGGGITVAGTLNMNGGTIANIHMHNSANATVQYGAAITVSGGTVNMYGGTIGGPTIDTANQNDGRNGAVGVVSGTFNMYGGTISGNVANEQGGGAGGVHISAGATFNMYDGSVSNNNSRRNGGGFYNEGTLNISGGTISGNTATYTDKNNDPTIFFGAGIYNTGTLTISGGEIINNVAKSCGGGVYNLGTMTMTGGKIAGNTSQGYSAGGIFVDGTATLNISGGEISGNTAGQYGGAIAVTSSALNALVITECIFSGNTCGANQCGSDIYITTGNSSNVRTSYDYECIHFQLYVDRTGARYSASNAVAANSNVLTAGYGYVYVASGEGHSWGEWVTVTPATCTAAGTAQRTCANCGKVESQAIAALGHNWNAGVVTKAATCTAAGTKLFTCTRCGETKTESIAALGHDQSNATRVEPTCTTAGSISYTCPRCGQTFSESIPALGHNPQTVRVEPTCTEAGSTTTTCTRCGIVISSTVLPAKGHTPGDWEVVTPATKTSTGLKAIKCTVCGATIQSEVIPVIPDATIKAATVELQSVPANSVAVPVTFVGNEGVWSMGFYAVYDSELTLKGVLTGDVFETITDSPYEVNPATDSRAAAALAAAGVSTSGVKCYRFYAENYLFDNITNDGKICDLIFNVPDTTAYELPVKLVPISGLTINADAEDISLLKEDGAIVIPSNNNCDHPSFTWTITKAATCTETGTRAKVCDNCGRTLETQVIQALGHNWGAWVVTTPATCTAAGQETSTCSRCGAKQYRDIAAPGHTYSDYVTTKEATCTEEGILTATCTRCGETITDTIPALGHLAGEWEVTKEAVGSIDGLKVKKCLRCGEILDSEVIPAPEKTRITASTEEAEGNMTVNATISLDNNPGVWSMTLFVYYDEALTLNSVTAGTVFSASEITTSAYLRRDPDFMAESISAFNECGVDMAGKKVTAVLLLSDSDVADVTGDGVLLNLSFTAPDVVEGNYAFGVVYNSDDIYNVDYDELTVERSSGEIVVRESICEHVWSAWTTVDAATCTEAGSEERTCSVCGKVETRAIAPLGHDVQNPTRVEPSCTEAGYEGGVCARCGQLIAETIPALGHNWGEWTQVDDTHLQRVCARCGEVETREITADPTLSVIGKNVREGETFTVPVMITGNPGVWQLLSYVYFDPALHLDSVTCGDVFAASELELSSDLNRLPTDSANAMAAFDAWDIDPAGYRLASLYFVCDALADNYGNGLLATLTFTAPDEEGTYFVGVITLPEEVFNVNEDEVAFELSNSEVVVSACNHVAGNVETVPATCTEDGYTRVYCSICGNVIEETIIKASGHQPGEWEIVTPATASTSGLKVKKCSVCGTVLEEKTILPIGSPAVSIGEATVYAGEDFTLPVTISNNPGIWGLHVYLTYADNISVKEIITDEDENVLGDVSIGKLNADPSTSAIMRQTFQEAGETTVGVRTVSVDMSNLENEDTTANGKLFDATFAGLPAGSYRIYLVMSEDECFNFDEENVPMNLEDVIVYVIDRPSCEHANTTTEEVDPTCTEAGYRRVTCDDCGAIVSNVVIPALGHNYVTTANVDATCTAAGSKTETCTRCGDVKVTTIPALGHAWGEWTQVDDHLERVCARCGEVETKPIPTTPTLSVAGKTVEAGETFTVTVNVSGNPGVFSLLSYVYFDSALHLDSVTCGDVFAASELELSTDLNRLPTDSANAMAAFDAWNVDYTGYRLATLYFIGDAIADNANNGVLATLTFTAPAEAGTYFVGIIDLPEEVYNAAEEEIVFDFDNSEVVVRAHEHVWGDWATVTEATCTEDGLKSRTCSACGEVETAVIEALGHNFSTEWTIDIEPTATTPGEKSHHCTRCDARTDITVIPPIPNYTLGDVNGDGKVNYRDSKLLVSYVSGTSSIDDIVFANTDINNDGKINMRDLSLLKSYLQGRTVYDYLLEAHGDI